MIQDQAGLCLHLQESECMSKLKIQTISLCCHEFTALKVILLAVQNRSAIAHNLR